MRDRINPYCIYGGYLCPGDFYGSEYFGNKWVQRAFLLLKKLVDEDTRENLTVDIIFSLSSKYSKSSEDTNDPRILLIFY